MLQSSHTALVNKVDALRMRVDFVLIGDVSEYHLTLRKDAKSLLEVLLGYPGLVADVDSTFNWVMARLSKLEATTLNVGNVLDKPAELSQRARHSDGTKRHAKMTSKY